MFDRVNWTWFEQRIEDRGIDVDEVETESGGLTAAHIAAEAGFVDILHYLFSRDPGIAQFRMDNGHTPLHRAALGGQLDAAIFLLELFGADPVARDHVGETPLEKAEVSMQKMFPIIFWELQQLQSLSKAK